MIFNHRIKLWKFTLLNFIECRWYKKRYIQFNIQIQYSNFIECRWYEKRYIQFNIFKI